MNLNPRTVILAIVALVIAAGTGWMVQSWMKAQRASILASIPKPKKEVRNEVRVLVAKRTLPAGLLIKPRDLEWRAWPKRGVLPIYAVEGKHKIETYTGAVVRKAIIAGEPITTGRVAKPGDRGFMAAVLTPGMRAISIPVNAISGIAGFVFPGDRIDLILIQKRGGGKSGRVVRFAETVFKGIRILAMDQSTNDATGKPRISKIATIEVTPKQAEQIILVTQLGKLSFSLRSLALKEGENGELIDQIEGPAKRSYTVTKDIEASVVLGGVPGTPPPKTVDVLRGSKKSKVRF